MENTYYEVVGFRDNEEVATAAKRGSYEEAEEMALDLKAEDAICMKDEWNISEIDEVVVRKVTEKKMISYETGGRR